MVFLTRTLFEIILFSLRCSVIRQKHISRIATYIYHGAYQLKMAFGLENISFTDEVKITNKANNLSEIFCGFLKTVVCKKFNSSTHKIASQLFSKRWVLQSRIKKKQDKNKTKRKSS